MWYHAAEGRWETGRAQAPVKAGKGKAQGGKEMQLHKKATCTSEMALKEHCLVTKREDMSSRMYRKQFGSNQ